MQPFFFGGSSSSLSKSGTRGVGLCGVVTSFSDVELFCTVGRDAITGVMRYPPLLVPGRGLLGSLAASPPRGQADASCDCVDFVGEPPLGLRRCGFSELGCSRVCCCVSSTGAYAPSLISTGLTSRPPSWAKRFAWVGSICSSGGSLGSGLYIEASHGASPSGLFIGFLGPELEGGRMIIPPVPDRTRGLLAFAVGGRAPEVLRAPEVGVSLLGTRAFCGECE